MLRRLTGRADACRCEAFFASVRAAQATDADLRRGYDRLAREWINLATSYELAEQVAGALAWWAEALPPPEESAIVVPHSAAEPVAQIEDISIWRKKLRHGEGPAGRARTPSSSPQS